MKLDYVSIEKRGGIAIVRFDRKANLNAFNEKLVVELTHAARGFFDDLETHVVILAGAPNAFSAGFSTAGSQRASIRWTCRSIMLSTNLKCSAIRVPRTPLQLLRHASAA